MESDFASLELQVHLQLNRIRTLHLCYEVKHPILTVFHTEPYGTPAYRRQQKKDLRFSRRQSEILVGVCRKLSNMKGLRDLHVTFSDSTGRGLEVVLLHPLWMIKNVENFQVNLPWALEPAVGAYHENETLPFIIRRPALEEDNPSRAVYSQGGTFRLWMYKFGRFLIHPYRMLQ
ncbi:hypothetical protein BOTCAL_0005g00360 [Botryotinia calthae]|uniref:DUF7730 domain-containing protein n=1 Tax=Botryotinia calthae TaxID=38488 RepID=A0A4Y8DHM6_9HELO|nr:hypothetical protein BOTCAL_0005g00360 [Botryotinia calthae]